LNEWAKYFDYFWNDGLSGVSTDVVRFNSPSFREIKRIYRFILLKNWVTASEVARRAKHWYVGQKQPRFLWMHLMEPHLPYFPGLRKGLEEGLLKSYRANLEFARDPDNCSKDVLHTIQNLYWKSIDKLDEQIPELLEFIHGGATVLIMADHGEEFFHGVHRHARLYDECVRVPLLIRWTLPSSPVLPREALRQIDIPPTVLKGLNIPIPDNWQGRAAQEESFLLSPMINHVPQLGRTYIGIRTENRKLIVTFDSNTGQEIRRELYDLGEDREERNDIYNNVDAEDLEEYLREFLQSIKSSSGERERLRRLGERLRKQGL
jgi:arylsulfatase A-like enzyme